MVLGQRKGCTIMAKMIISIILISIDITNRLFPRIINLINKYFYERSRKHNTSLTSVIHCATFLLMYKYLHK